VSRSFYYNAECRYAASLTMLNGTLRSGIMLNGIMLGATMLNGIMMSVPLPRTLVNVLNF
jgi:hypothetical protein